MAAEMEVSMWGLLISSTSSWSCSATARRRDVRLGAYKSDECLDLQAERLVFGPVCVFVQLNARKRAVDVGFSVFKFAEHLRKILKTLDYFLVKFELISSIKIK